MKRYIHIALIALVAQCGLSNVVYAMNIAPTTLGDDAIVNSIKQYSHLTEADVNQWKLLRLGELGTYGSFIAGAISVLGAGVGTYQKSGTVQSITSQVVPSWMTNSVVLAGLSSLGAGYVSYKTLYPRMRAGVLDKVQRFIDVCEALRMDSLYRQHAIVNFNFLSLRELQQSYLPRSWNSSDDMAVYNALLNLEQQGKVALALLGQVGLVGDPELKQKHDDIGMYTRALSHNRALYEWSQVVQQKKNEPQYQQAEERRKRQEKLQEQLENAQLAHLEAGTSAQQAGARLMQVQATKTYFDMVSDIGISIKDTINYLYKNKEKMFYRGGVLLGAGYGAYAYMRNWLTGKQ